MTGPTRTPPGASTPLRAGLAVAAAALVPLAGGSPAEAQGASPPQSTRGGPDAVRLVAPASVGVFVDWFGVDDAVVGTLGAGAGLEVGVSDRVALRAEGQLVVPLAEDNRTVDGAEGFFLPGIVLFLGGGTGPRPHLRGGAALGTSELGGGAFLGGGFPVSEHLRLQGRATATQQGPAFEAGVSLVFP